MFANLAAGAEQSDTISAQLTGEALQPSEFLTLMVVTDPTQRLLKKLFVLPAVGSVPSMVYKNPLPPLAFIVIIQFCNDPLQNRKLRVSQHKFPHIRRCLGDKPFISGNSVFKSFANLSTVWCTTIQPFPVCERYCQFPRIQ